jgi:hypothetical protein
LSRRMWDSSPPTAAHYQRPTMKRRMA